MVITTYMYIETAEVYMCAVWCCVFVQAETELREAQAEFDIQLNKVRDAMKKVIQTHTHYLGYLKSFMAAQKDYHRECLSQLENIDTSGIM